jgi:ATP-dependent RNA helicase DDX52/ROK1
MTSESNVFLLASSFLRDHVQITVGVENAGATTIDQKLLFVTSEEGKLLAMRQLIQVSFQKKCMT